MVPHYNHAHFDEHRSVSEVTIVTIGQWKRLASTTEVHIYPPSITERKSSLSFTSVGELLYTAIVVGIAIC